MLVDQEAQEMVIEHAYGPGSEKAVGIRFPLGHGIAGLTAVSGQPMAISDAASDPRHAAEVAERIGYRPNTLLCVPLVSQEQVIGVFQLLDKTRGRTFTTADIDTLGVFAEQAAIAVEQSRVQERLAEVVGQILASQSGESGRNAAVAAARAFARGIEYESPYQEILRSARLLQQIAAFGDQERRLCATILGDLLAYLQSRPQLDLPRAW
jgi:GAF domain-containing protein